VLRVNTSFQLERWREFAKEAAPLFQQHWEEIAIDREKIKLSLDQERYQAMDDAGILLILTARVSGTLAGYYLAFLLPHVHYREAGLMAFTDIYFLAPEFRQGTRGIQLIEEAEKSLRAKGVTKAYLSCKVHRDNTPLFERLGWKLTDKSFTKFFGD
jgi:GNAT superfamily N-acetyltransferase